MTSPQGLFVVGASRCGTTTVWQHLRRHPNIHMPKPKEPHYWDREVISRSKQHYLDNVRPDYTDERYTGDARHRIMYHPYSIQYVHDLFPDARLVVMVRDPVDRAYSHWYWWKHMNTSYEKSLRDGLRDDWAHIARHGPFRNTQPGTFIDSGYYHPQIQRVVESFGRDHVKICQLKGLADNAETFMDRIYDWLDLEQIGIHADKNWQLSSTGSPPRDIVDWLTHHYHPYNQRLKEFGVDTLNWRSPR